MKPIHIERLRTLYAYFSGIPAERVNLRAWRENENSWDNDVSTRSLLHDCGSNGCILGWACAIPEFRAQGLGYQHLTGRDAGPRYRGLSGFRAGEAFFGITPSEATKLFTGHRYADSTELNPAKSDKQIGLRRIRRFLMSKGLITPARNRQLAARDKGGE